MSLDNTKETWEIAPNEKTQHLRTADTFLDRDITILGAGMVRYDEEQNLTDEQKQQARDNIDIHNTFEAGETAPTDTSVLWIDTTDDSGNGEVLWEAGSGENSVQVKDSHSVAIGNYSVAEGYATVARGHMSHTEGVSTITVNPNGSSVRAEWNDAYAAHAEGHITTAAGRCSHVEGDNTVTNNPSEHAEGRYNVSNYVDGSAYGNAGNTQHSIGIGNNEFNHKNAFEVMQNGDAYMIGVGDYDGKNAQSESTKTLQNVLNSKQDALIAGEGISIAEDGKTISAEAPAEVKNAIETEGIGWTETNGYNIIWDGVVGDRDVATYYPDENFTMVKVADYMSPIDLDGAILTAHTSDDDREIQLVSGRVIDNVIEYDDDKKLYFDVDYPYYAMVNKSGAFGDNWNFPSAGLYVYFSNDSFISRVRKGTEIVHQIADKYLPDIPTQLSQLTGDSTHRTVTDAEKETWGGKQDAISDLTNIRSGAALGATALQTAPVVSINGKTGAVNLVPADLGIGSVFQLKGSKPTYADLPASGNAIGDVWYVIADSVGYIWLNDGTTDRWEQLGMEIDLSVYRTSAAQDAIDSGKVAISQGVAHAGKIMAIDASGNIVPISITDIIADGDEVSY